MSINYLLIFVGVLACNISQQGSPTINNKQQVSIVLCDTSSICFQDKVIRDTISGKGVIRLHISTENNEFDVIDEKIILLILENKSGDRLLDYRYLITDSLTVKENCLYTKYGDKIRSLFKDRGLCVYGDGDIKELDSEYYDFPFVFSIIPFRPCCE
ncbi:hypothetical protein EYV94_22775 [Puteibacter caeruleilacunae]|nr:hypothetical protein EYV94_22775 [Puteibacter caeruleilacunae]